MHFKLDSLAVPAVGVLLLIPSVSANFFIRAWQSSPSGGNVDEIWGMQQCMFDQGWEARLCNQFGYNCEAIDTNQKLPTCDQIKEIKECIPKYASINAGWSLVVGTCNYVDDNYESCNFQRCSDS